MKITKKILIGSLLLCCNSVFSQTQTWTPITTVPSTTIPATNGLRLDLGEVLRIGSGNSPSGIVSIRGNMATDSHGSILRLEQQDSNFEARMRFRHVGLNTTLHADIGLNANLGILGFKVPHNNTPSGYVMSINNNGFVGINTNGIPQARFHVNLNAGDNIRFQNLPTSTQTSVVVIDAAGNLSINSNLTNGITNSCGTVNFLSKVSSTSGNLQCSQIFDNGTSVGIGSTGPFNYTWPGGLSGPTSPPSSGKLKLDINGVTRGLAFFATSDENLKTNIQQIKNASEIISNLYGTTYNWTKETIQETGVADIKQYGFIAQEVAKIVPEAVMVDENGKYGINYNSFIPLLVESHKDMSKKLEEEQEKNLELMETVNELSAKMEMLASQIEKLNGESQNNDKSEFKIFPNPNSGNFMIKHFIPSNSQKSYLVITSLDGKEMMHQTINCVGLCTSNINLKNTDNGTYSCTLYIDGKLITSDRFVYIK